MSEEKLETVAKRLATMRDIIMDREGAEVQDQFAVRPSPITVNVEGSGYSEDENVYTLIQVEKGPIGMEELLACAVEELVSETKDDPDSYLICGDTDKIIELLDDACDKVYRQWHWLDLPNVLPGSEFEEEDELEDDGSFSEL